MLKKFYPSLPSDNIADGNSRKLLRPGTPQTVSGAKTFSEIPVITGAPEHDDDLVTKGYIDSRLSGLSVTCSYTFQLTQEMIAAKRATLPIEISDGAARIKAEGSMGFIDAGVVGKNTVTWDFDRADAGDLATVVYQGFRLPEPFGISLFDGGYPFSGEWDFSAAVLGPTGLIYGIPDEGQAILVLDPNTRQVTSIPNLQNPDPDMTWMCGALAPNGCIYCPPYFYDAEQVLKIDTNANTFSKFGNFDRDTYGTYRWETAVLADNGYIYCIPSGSLYFLRINPTNDTAQVVGDTHYSNWLKWNGAALAPNGCIYGIPQSNFYAVKFDPSTETWTEIGGWSGLDKFKGAALAPNGKIYSAPYGTGILVIDTNDDSCYVIGETISGIYSKPVTAPNGKIYCLPYGASTILCIDPATDAIEEIGPFEEMPRYVYYYENAVVANNGRIYGIPRHGGKIIEVAGVGA